MEYLDVSNEIIQAESDETQNVIVTSLKPYFEQLQEIKNAIKVHRNDYKTSKGTYYTVVTEDEDSRRLLFQAYEIIQLIRQIITKEKLKYHLYIETKNGIEGIEIGATDLEKVISFGQKNKLAILESKVNEILKENNESKLDSMALFNAHYNQILKSMSPAKTSGYFVPSEEKRNRYGLFQQKEFAKGHRVPAIFNKGHLIESLDAVDHKNRLWQHHFYQNLQLDTVSGFQGGDNLMVQVKFKDARLMEFITIINGIDNVLQIQSLIESGSEKDVIKQAIKSMFFAGNGAEKFSVSIDKFITQLQDELLDPIEKFENT